jgi:hypothetical protein
LLASGIKRAFTKKGKTLDGMAEALGELGYFKGKYSENELLDLISKSLRGDKQYSGGGAGKAKGLAEADGLARLADGDDLYTDQLLSNLVDDMSFSAREINTELNNKLFPDDTQFAHFEKTLADNEMFPEFRSKEEIDEQLDGLENPEVEAAELADFERNIEIDGEDVIYMDDGTVVSIKALKEKFAEDEQTLEAITSCSIGGGE